MTYKEREGNPVFADLVFLNTSISKLYPLEIPRVRTEILAREHLNMLHLIPGMSFHINNQRPSLFSRRQ